MIFKDYYKILGLDNSKVSASEIKTAYREQAKLYHPDVNAKSSFSEERFKDINEAYRVLSNTTSKRRYDRMWNNHAAKKTIKVTRIGSTIGRPAIQEKNLKGLGLTKTGRTVEVEDTPAVRGMIRKVAHLVKVEE